MRFDVEVAPLMVGIPVSAGRVCNMCGGLFPATPEHFGHIKGNATGLNTRCRTCANRVARESMRERMRANREREWQEMTPEKRARVLERQRLLEERKAARSQRYHDGVLASSLNTRSRIYGDGGRITADDVAAIRAAQTDKRGRLICWRCRKPIEGKSELDHFIPVSRGGANAPGNLHFMHHECNRTKRDIHPHDLGMLI